MPPRRSFKFVIALLAGLSLLTGCATRAPRVSAAPVVQTLVKRTSSWNGARLPGYPPGQPEITILAITIPPGARLPLHQHPVINAGVVLEGELTVIAASGQTLRLRAGDALVELVNTPHYGLNEGRRPVKLIVFYAGTQSAPITAPAADTAPTPDGHAHTTSATR